MSDLIIEIKEKKIQYLKKIPRHRTAFYLFHIVAAAAVILFTLLL